MRDSKGRFASWTVNEYRIEFAKYGLGHLHVEDDQYGNVNAYAHEQEEGWVLSPHARAHVYASECDRDLGRKQRLACARLLTFLRVIGGVR